MYNYNIKDTPFFEFNADRMISETELLDMIQQYVMLKKYPTYLDEKNISIEDKKEII